MDETRSHGESAEWKSPVRAAAASPNSVCHQLEERPDERQPNDPTAGGPGKVDVLDADWRDVPGPMELAAHAVKETGGDLGDELGRLRAMSAEKVGSMVARLQNPAVGPSLQSSGYAGVTTLHAFGLVDCWSGGSE